jgi:membrane protease YdiL (CAAX protease family)
VRVPHPKGASLYGPAFDRFIAPAKARAELWRLALGLAVCGGAFAGLLAVAAAGYALWAGPASFRATMQILSQGSTPVAMLAILASFLAMAAGPVLAVRLIHKRRSGTLIGPGARALRDFARGTLAVAAVYAVALTIWNVAYDWQPGLPPATWALFLVPALIGLAIQTGAEELLFRGYILQQLAARFRSPVIWAFLPALAFGILHFDAGRMGASMAAWAVVATTLFGLMAADLTARTGSLGAAWGLHFGNNAFGILLLGTPGNLSGLALFLTPYSAADMAQAGAVPVLDILFLTIAWWVTRRLCTR